MGEETGNRNMAREERRGGKKTALTEYSCHCSGEIVPECSQPKPVVKCEMTCVPLLISQQYPLCIKKVTSVVRHSL